MVRAAGQAASPSVDEALESLCAAYWFPLYAYVRRHGFSKDDAEDLTQAFSARLAGRGQPIPDRGWRSNPAGRGV